VAWLSDVAVKRSRQLRLPAAALLAAALSLASDTHAKAAEEDPWFGRDKALHFSACLSLSTVGYAGAALATPDTTFRLVTGAGLAMTAGIAKEVYALHEGGDASWRDLTWDVLGTTTGLVTAWLIDRYLL
jgi:putative lipoprotein